MIRSQILTNKILDLHRIEFESLFHIYEVKKIVYQLLFLDSFIFFLIILYNYKSYIRTYSANQLIL